LLHLLLHWLDQFEWDISPPGIGHGQVFCEGWLNKSDIL